MKIFLDTSSLIKLYFKEAGTTELDKIFADNIVTEIYISEIAKTEFFSAIYKKLRIQVLTIQNVRAILDAFVVDEQLFKVILIDRSIVNSAQLFIEKYGVMGLRTLDAIQLASVFSIRNSVNLAVSHDKLLNSFLHLENIQILDNNI